MDSFLNQDITEWIDQRQLTAEDELKMVADVRLFASDWEIKDFSGIADKDSYNPLYAGQSERVKALKTKPYWKFINPIYRLYANVKVRSILFFRMDKKTAFVKLKNKIAVKWKNRKTVIMRRNRRFLKGIELFAEERKEQEQTVFSKDIKISVIVPLYNTPERFLRDMIESVQAQTFVNWELCLGDGSDEAHPDVERIAWEYGAKDKRIVYRRLEKNEGISSNTNACLAFATGNYVALMDHDDMLHPAALFRCAMEIEKNNAEFVYTDEMTFQRDSIKKIVTLHFKPAYSPQNLNGVNYITHLIVFKKSLLDQNGVYNDAYDGSQDHDMILRLTTAAAKVSHVPEILYFWRVHPESVSADISAKPYAIDAGRRAVHDNEARLGREAEIHSSCICATHYRLEYVLPEEPEISIVVMHFNAAKPLARFLSSLDKRTKYRHFKVVIADCGSTETEASDFLSLLSKNGITVVKKEKEENLPQFLNRIVQDLPTPYVTFLDAATEIMDELWLSRLVQYEMQPEIGLTGSRLTDAYGMVEEAGYIIGLGEDGIALPIEHKNNYSAPGYMGRMYYAHNVSALSLFGAMVSKEKWETVGGLCEALTDPAYLGIDLSLRFRAKGMQVVLNPYVIQTITKQPLEGMFPENTSQLRLERDQSFMKKNWGEVLAAGDPYYNPHLNHDGSFTFEM